MENDEVNKQEISDKQDDTMWIIYENAREKNMQSLLLYHRLCLGYY